MSELNSTLDFSILKDLRIKSNIRPLPSRAFSLIGRAFHRLTPYGFVGATTNGDALWLCRCACGNFLIARAAELKRNHARSCGGSSFPWDACYKRPLHGLSKTLAYATWCSIFARCCNTNNPSYPNYGGRGVTICARWRVFENFYADMGDRPSLKHSIERVNNNGNYEPENCVWATKIAQARNTRATRWLTIGDETLSAAEWAERYSLRASIVYERLGRGWSTQEALGLIQRTELTSSRTRWITAFGKTQSLSAWSRETGFKLGTIRQRLLDGWKAELALSLPLQPPKRRVKRG